MELRLKELAEKKKKYARISISNEDLKELIAIEMEEMALDPETFSSAFLGQVQFLRSTDAPLKPFYRGNPIEGESDELVLIKVVGSKITLEASQVEEKRVRVHLTSNSSKVLKIATYFLKRLAEEKQQQFEYGEFEYPREQRVKGFADLSKVTLNWTMSMSLYAQMIQCFPSWKVLYFDISTK